MTMAGCGYPSSGNEYEILFHVPKTPPGPSESCVRGKKAGLEMMNRPGMTDRADKFCCKEPGFASDLVPYFYEKIREENKILPLPPSEDDYVALAHRVFNIYRREVVEKACKEVDADPLSWTFKDRNEWNRKRLTFQDFMWQYFKMVYSGAAWPAITKVMKEKVPSLPRDFWPSRYPRHLAEFSGEQDDFYPNS